MNARKIFILCAVALMIALTACAPAPTPAPTAAPPTSAPPVATTAPSGPTATRPAATTAATTAPSPTAISAAVTAAPNAVKIQFWHYFTDPTQAAAVQRFADKFNAANPQYYIIPTVQGNIPDLNRKINAAIQANAAPDMASGNPGDLFDYNTSGGLAALDQLIGDPKDGLTADMVADLTPANLFFDKLEGKTLGISLGRSAQVMYYNADMLKAAGFTAPPATWDDFDKICAAITKGDAYCYATLGDTSAFASMVLSRGGTYANADEKKATFDEPAGVDTLKWIKNQVDKGWGKVPTVLTRGDQADFGNGKLAFAFGSTAGLPFFQDAVNGRKEGPFQWDVAPVPGGPKGKQVVDIFGPSFGIFKSTPDKQKGAWLFLKFMLQKDNQVDWALRLFYFPATKSGRDAIAALDADAVKAVNARAALVLPQFKKAGTFISLGVREPLSPAWQGVRGTIANMMTAVITGKTSPDFTASDPEAAAKEGAQRVNTQLSQYGK